MASRLTNKTVAHLRSVRATMSQKSSDPQAVSFASQALKRDTGVSTWDAQGILWLLESNYSDWRSTETASSVSVEHGE